MLGIDLTDDIGDMHKIKEEYSYNYQCLWSKVTDYNGENTFERQDQQQTKYIKYAIYMYVFKIYQRLIAVYQ